MVGLVGGGQIVVFSRPFLLVVCKCGLSGLQVAVVVRKIISINNLNLNFSIKRLDHCNELLLRPNVDKVRMGSREPSVGIRERPKRDMVL